MANSVDPEQALHSVVAECVYTVCSGLSVPLVEYLGLLRYIYIFTYCSAFLVSGIGSKQINCNRSAFVLGVPLLCFMFL